eukprot:152959_1
MGACLSTPNTPRETMNMQKCPRTSISNDESLSPSTPSQMSEVATKDHFKNMSSLSSINENDIMTDECNHNSCPEAHDTTYAVGVHSLSSVSSISSTGTEDDTLNAKKEPNYKQYKPRQGHTIPGNTANLDEMTSLDADSKRLSETVSKNTCVSRNSSITLSETPIPNEYHINLEDTFNTLSDVSELTSQSDEFTSHSDEQDNLNFP